MGVSTGGAVKQYPTMSVRELCDLDVGWITAADALLYMWTTGPMILTDTPPVIEAWGFTPATVAFVWNKVLTNPGYYTLSQCEFCVVAKYGRIPAPRGSRNERQWVETVEETDLPQSEAIEQLRERHSAKPVEVRDRIARMHPTQRKIELFARERAEGWTSWGSEVPP